MQSFWTTSRLCYQLNRLKMYKGIHKIDRSAYKGITNQTDEIFFVWKFSLFLDLCLFHWVGYSVPLISSKMEYYLPFRQKEMNSRNSPCGPIPPCRQHMLYRTQWHTIHRGQPPQLHGFVCAYNPAVLGSNPKHTIYAFFNLYY